MAWSSSDRAQRLPADWPKRRARVLRRDGWRCQIRGPLCRGIAREVDHIEHGDDHRDANLQSVCVPCHRDKTQLEATAGRADARERSARPAEPHPGDC